ncbi:MAG: DUF1152 domain-containing protein [Candidatus Helarchaeota archaeon]
MQKNQYPKTEMNQSPQIGIDHMLKNVRKVLISGIGGGGDVLTALHVRWALEKVAPHIEWVQGGVTGGPISHFTDIEKITEDSGWVSGKSKSKPPHRLIEATIARKLNEKIFLLSCYNGVGKMIAALNSLITMEGIEMFIFIDGGTDSLAFVGSSVRSPTEDTMALAAIGLGEFSTTLQYRVAGVSVVGSDAEMTLEEISKQLLKISRAGGYIGGTFFPIERLTLYSEILSEVLQEYPTATALTPLLVTGIQFRGRQGSLYSEFSNGFQLATFLFDAKVVAEVANDFTHLILNLPTRTAVKQAILSYKGVSKKGGSVN